MKSLIPATLFILVLTSASWAEADTYHNCGISEPAINGSANTLWCDDFESGDMVFDNTGTSNAANKGYIHTPFGWGASHFPDAAGHGFGRCGTATGVALVVGGTPGAAGTNCAASSGDTMDGAAEGQVPSMSDHGLSEFIEQGQDLYFRYYKKCVTVTGCFWSTNTKNSPTINRLNGWGGIDFGNAGAQPNAGECTALPAGCTVSRHTMNIMTNGGRALRSNQGTDDGTCAAGHSCWERGTNYNHWYYIEHHIKMNTAGSANGEYDLWMDDCGTDGTTGGCATGGTLRTHYSDVQWVQANGQTPSGATHIGSLWIEQYSSGGTGAYVLIGQWYLDQIVASRVRVGPMGSRSTDITPPFTPVGLTIR